MGRDAHRAAWAGIAVNPQSTDPKYIAQDLNIFGFDLSAPEMAILSTWKPAGEV